MKALIQRVSRGSVTVGGRVAGAIGRGYVVLLGVREGDADDDARYLAERTVNLRVFPDDAGRMNLSLAQAGGDLLVVPQFTLYADTRRGNRPSFIRSGPPEAARRLCGVYNGHVGRLLGAGRVQEGVFGAEMTVEIVNEGPVTIELTSDGRGG